MRSFFAVAAIVGLMGCGSPPGPQAIPTGTALDGGAGEAPPTALAAKDAGPSGLSGASPCEGRAVNLLAAIADPRCRITEDEAERLREVLEDPARIPLRIDAVVTDRALRQLAIVNTGAAPVTLPLFVHSHVDSFPTQAGALTLAPPLPAWPAGFAFETGRMLAKVVLPPGGRAWANVRLDLANLTVTSNDAGDCPPNAKCAPKVVRRGPLPPGTYFLRFKTPLYTARADLEARVRWSVGDACPPPTPCGPGQRMVSGCAGGTAPRPEDCPPPGRCVPANMPVPPCPAVP